MIVEVLDLKNVLLFLFNNVGVSIYCKAVMAMILLALLAPKISWAVLILLASLVLVGGRLMFATRYVSRRSVKELSPSRIFFFLFYRPVLSETL